MTIHLESQVVSSSFDSVTRIYSYTITRGARRWTVQITQDEFERQAPTKMQRRVLVAQRLEAATGAQPDA